MCILESTLYFLACNDINMDFVNIILDSTYSTLICKVCKSCIRPSSFESHLRKRHLIKGAILHAALQDFKKIKDQCRDPAEIPRPAEPIPIIPLLAVTKRYQCTLCDGAINERFSSDNWRTVERHQRNEHAVPDRRSKEWKAYKQGKQLIDKVSMQSFLPNPYFRPFVINDINIPGSSTNNLDNEQLLQDYETSKQSELLAFAKIQENSFKSQIPPWLKSLGVYSYLNN